MKILLGVAMALAGWLATRRTSGRHAVLGADLWPDLGLSLLAIAAMIANTAKPLFSGVVLFTVLFALAFADGQKRRNLREPLVFSDIFVVVEVFRHPGLYLPFIGPIRVVFGMAAGCAALLASYALEPPLWPFVPTALIVDLLLLAVAGGLRGRIAELLGSRPLAREPAADCSQFGLVWTLLTYAVVAHMERDTRRRRAIVRAEQHDRPPGAGYPAPVHVVIVQCESFIDPRRLPGCETLDVLGAIDAARAGGSRTGRLETSAWGANTARTEFQVLTGIDDHELGFDRYDPYRAFSREKIPSLAWTLKERGYRTVFIHPFDKTFYGRDIVLPNLGFEEFHGLADFEQAPTRRGYVTDEAIAGFTERLIQTAREPTFAFIVTMENHGPWQDKEEEESDELDLYIAGVKSGDALFGRLRSCLAESGGLLGLYGDHAPSLKTSEGLMDTDYILVGGNITGLGQQDLPACGFGALVLQALEPSAEAGWRRDPVGHPR